MWYFRPMTYLTLKHVFVLVLAYYITGKIGLQLDAVNGFATLVWAPAGISLATLLLFGYKLWPGVALGAFLVNTTSGAPFLTGLGIACGNTLAALVGTYLINRSRFRPTLERLHDVISLIFYGAILSTLVSASIGTASLLFTNIVLFPTMHKTWIAWWIGDMIGILIFAPIILVFMTLQPFKLKPRRFIELFIAYTILILISLILFRGFFQIDTKTLPIIYLLFPPLLWIVIRFTQRETIAAIFLLSFFSIWGTVEGYGTFARTSLIESLYFLQGFLGTTSSTFMILSSILSEKRALEIRKDDFISIASHELKTPLTTIKAYSDLVKMSLKNTKNKQLKTYAAKLESQVDKVNELINELLDASKIESGKISITHNYFDINILLKELVNDLNTYSKNNKIVYIGGDKALIVYADKFRISQVITNLLNNALKFSPTKKNVVVSTNKKKGVIEIYVKDYGIGIDREHHKLIFDRFAQVESGTTVANSGLGLGLYISSEIVKKHQGKIWVESEVGKGSTFYFTLPTSPRKD